MNDDGKQNMSGFKPNWALNYDMITDLHENFVNVQHVVKTLERRLRGDIEHIDRATADIQMCSVLDDLSAELWVIALCLSSMRREADMLVEYANRCEGYVDDVPGPT